MAYQFFTEEIRDQNAHSYRTARPTNYPALLRFINRLDTEVTIDVRGTDDLDADFSDVTDLALGEVVAADSVHEYEVTSLHERLSVEVTATGAAAPTAGSIEGHRVA